jgi:hypothetical protein
MFNSQHNHKVEILDERLKFFENLSKDMSNKLQISIDKITDSNQNIVHLISIHDNRLNLLDASTKTISDDIHELSKNLESHVAKEELYFEKLQNNFSVLENKILDIANFKSIIVWSATAIITIIGIMASAGWISPSRFPDSSPKIQTKY